MPNLSKKLLFPALVAVATALFACEISENKGSDALQSSELGLGADHAFRVRSTIADDQGQTHVRYDHLYRGVRVWQGDTIVHSGPMGLSTTGNLMKDIKVATVPALNARAALAIAHQDLKPKGAYARNPTAELVIYPQVREVVSAKPMRGPGGELTATDIEQVIDGYTLAYYVHSELENGAAETAHTDYLIDAQSGSILKKWDALQTAAANGTGISEYSGTVTIGTNSVGSSWEMRDVARAMNFATYNLNHGTSGTGTIYTDTDNTWGDGADYISGGSTTNANGQTAAVDAHYGVAKTFDYYKNVHGRNGIDNANGATYSRVHYSSNYDNAFWSDSCFCMTYGDGNVFNVLTSLDVAGHEMSHGVTSRTANLTYSGESGGLNESMSDIGGTMVEFYARGGSGSTIGNTGGNWLIGEQLRATPLRYMYKPSKDGSSKDAWYSGIGSIDVHYSSGPFNRFFYFLSQGASSSSSSDYYSSYLPGGMTGIGNDKAARIVYKALVSYMTSSTNYAAARTACLNAATALGYASGSAEYTAVQNAMAAINVGGGGGGGTVTTLQNGVGLGNQSGSTGASAFYKITVASGQTSLVVTTSGGTGDADLYVKFGSQPDTSSYDCRSIGSTTAETCTISNPSAGDYYITLYAYTTYSGVTITATYSGGGGGGDPYLTNGVPVTGISGATGSQQYWRLAVPSGQAKVVFTISGGTGDADLYVRLGSRPTTTSYNCRPYLNGNNETCTINSPAAGDWYVMLRGYSAFSGVTLKGQYP